MSRNVMRVLIILCTAFLAIGCTSHSRWQRQKDQIEGLQQTRRAIPAVGGYRDFAGVVHVHSLLSHDSKGTMDEIVEGAKRAGLAFVIMTDHHRPKVYQRGFEGWFEDVLIIRGSEIIRGCRTRRADSCNSLLVLGLRDYLNPKGLTMHEVIDEVKKRGGLAIAAHPNGFTAWDHPGVDGFELYDILDDALDHPWRFPKYFFDILYSYRSYPDQVFLSILDRPDENLKKWDERSQRRRWVGLAGNDAHQNIRILGRLIDPYPLSFRFVRTHILAKELNESEVLRALAAGHTYVAFDLLSDATGFNFWAEDGAVQGIQGDEVRLTPVLRLMIESPVVGLIELIRNGTVVRKTTTLHLTLPVEEAGVYRAQISLKIGGRWQPWIFSNPIYVRAD